MGYDIERFIGPINDGLLCCICRDVLEDPLQAPCEHAFCSVCIHGWLVHENFCPEDRRTLWASELKPIFRYMKNDLNQLQIRCKNTRAGCTFVCDLEHAAAHDRECPFDTVECPSVGCTVMVERRQMEEHLQSCEFRTRECPRGCGLPLLSTEDADHNCIAELRTTLELLRSEMICKVEDQKQEMELRLDAQRRHMVQRESALQSQVDELKSQMSRLTQDVQILSDKEKQRVEETQRLELEKKELMDLLRSLHIREPEERIITKKHICRQCHKTEKVTLL
ncbi:RING finger protein 151 [Lingula anatina]|uniref:RING finger protein 151 n=1 Tax=Lingula anatina TaxID=7574 RepID=A0A1S3I2L7_LINAN|nr:RING finger protein 151 [Lingula anatina]XP_023931353.1 RING finger protein 151 [Lingula anatina]|eukprot:XP_013392516.1 RING finger protein 151 [Lingula anatina]